MKHNLSSLRIVMTAFLIANLIVACKKNNNQDIQPNRTTNAGGPSGPSGSCGDSTISGVITSNLTLRSCKIYKLERIVYVANNAILTIEPGTVIKGIKDPNPGGPWLQNPGGGLIITHGAKIIAEGTPADPIIFTSNEPNPVSGDWSGVVLLGKAPTNHFSAVIVEGISSNPIADATYGGPNNNIPNDNSGILKYVRIEYAGYELAPDNELNGLTLAGVGSGTILDYIEVYKAKDDAFQFFGGTVNASHLLAVDPLDDLFDTNNGYTGTISYALGITDLTRADKSQSNGIESANNANGDPIAPYTHPTFQNITIVGVANATNASITNGEPSGTGKYGRAAHLRRNTEFSITNSIFLGYNYGISLDTQKPVSGANTKTKYDAGTSTLTGNFVHAFVVPYSTEVNFASFAAFTPLGTTNRGYSNSNPNLNIGLANPFSVTRAISNYIPHALSPAKAFGAFPTGNTIWANGWTRL